MFFFFNISLHFPFQNKENWKCLLTSTNVSALCLDLGQCYPTSTHIRALLSRSSREMKFNSSSWYFAFETMLEFFCKLHILLNHEHIRQGDRIIAMIALRSAILMKVDHVVSLHAHRLFSGRACSCTKDPCSQSSKYMKKSDREIRVRLTL